jgi:hypothetical protein
VGETQTERRGLSEAAFIALAQARAEEAAARVRREVLELNWVWTTGAHLLCGGPDGGVRRPLFHPLPRSLRA